MDIYVFEVPSTMEMGSFKGHCTSNGFNVSYKQDALWSYNSARSHDGLRPLKKMPKGTKYYKEVRGNNSDGSYNYMYVPVR
jgi:hypothetical protein